MLPQARATCGCARPPGPRTHPHPSPGAAHLTRVWLRGRLGPYADVRAFQDTTHTDILTDPRVVAVLVDIAEAHSSKASAAWTSLGKSMAGSRHGAGSGTGSLAGAVPGPCALVGPGRRSVRGPVCGARRRPWATYCHGCGAAPSSSIRRPGAGSSLALRYRMQPVHEVACRGRALLSSISKQRLVVGKGPQFGQAECICISCLPVTLRCTYENSATSLRLGACIEPTHH